MQIRYEGGGPFEISFSVWIPGWRWWVPCVRVSRQLATPSDGISGFAVERVVTFWWFSVSRELWRTTISTHDRYPEQWWR